MHESLKNDLYKFVQENPVMPKSEIVARFTGSGYKRRSIYRWLSLIEQKKSLIRKKGSGRKAKIATKQNILKVKNHFNHKSGRSQKNMASKLGCHRTYIGKILKKYSAIRLRKKQKRPLMSEQQKAQARAKCRRMLEKYGHLDFILDDESYFTLSNDSQPGNDSFYSDNVQQTPETVRNKFKTKYEKKIMVWLAISPRGVSNPYFVPSGLAVNQHVYIKECIKKRLEPMIKKYYSGGGYVFWPDLASSHYAKLVQKHLVKQNIPFVAKTDNPANVPKARPIEDFWGNLKQKVYDKCWKAKNLKELENKIKLVMRNMDLNLVQRHCMSVRRRLDTIRRYGVEKLYN